MSDHMLDLLINRSVGDLSLGSPTSSYAISDHYSVITSLGFPKPALSSRQVSFRKLKDINIADFQADVASLTLPQVSTDFDDLVSKFCSSVMNILDRHAPEKSKVIVVSPKVPWLTYELRDLKRKHRKLERAIRKSGLISKPFNQSVRNTFPSQVFSVCILF